MSKAKLFIQNLVQEVRYKITWPSYHGLQSNSLIVLLVSYIFALLIGLMDWSLKKAFVWFYNAF
ncbi:preprotein translocase subunit SecE [Candidatus Cardinium hertigii]|uniref:preprotein translocase subunit SecE n=1 Tax=Candidatus Cardinium hertigii TaxID=247481 RepID=UPI003D7EABE2